MLDLGRTKCRKKSHKW